jgi:hypothetical protein
MWRQAVKVFTWAGIVAGVEVTGWQVAMDWEMGSEDGGTPPPVLTQECDFMGVIFRGNVRV